MRLFAGLCKGGPFDGTELVHTAKSYRVVEVPDENAFDKLSLVEQYRNQPVNDGYYHWHDDNTWVWQ